MAILGLCECQVLVDNKPLKEYDDDDNDNENEQPIDPKIIAKYIEAYSGTNFVIKVGIKPGFDFDEADYVSVDIILDGDVKRRAIVEKELYAKSKGTTHFKEISGGLHRNGTKHFLRRFRFGGIKTGLDQRWNGGHDASIIRVPSLGLSLMGVLQVGETRASGTADIPRARYDNLGSIKVEVWRKKIISKDGSLDQYESRLGEVIPEKEVKGRALTLVTSLDEPEVTTDRRTVRGKRTDGNPVAVFEFKYRSNESLKQLHIIPRTRSPTPLEERPLEDLSVEEARELLRRQKAEAEATKVRVKKERAETNLQTLRAVKRFREDMGVDEENEVEAIAERSAHKKQRPVAGQEVIDLSD